MKPRRQNGEFVMGASTNSLSDAATAVVLIAVFVIVSVVARGALKEIPLFGHKGGWTVAVCVAALSALGLLRFFGSSGYALVASEPRDGDGVLDIILLPYVCLALSTVLVLLLLASRRWWPGRNAAPWKQRAKLMSKVKMLTGQEQTASKTTLRKRLEK
jgi:hypothetical protein